MFTKKDSHKNIYRSLICNNPKLELTQMSTNKGSNSGAFIQRNTIQQLRLKKNELLIHLTTWMNHILMSKEPSQKYTNIKYKNYSI